MIPFAGKISCFVMLACLLAGDGSVLTAASTPRLSDRASSSATSPDAVADTMSVFRPFEVRTRKMHLVRPDLLHYPMQMDVYA